MAWRNFAEKNPDLPVGFVIQGATGTELPDDVVAAYEAPYPNAESKAGAARFPLLVPARGGRPRRGRDEGCIGGAGALGEAGADCLLRLGPGLPLSRTRADASSTLIPGAGEQVKIEGAAHFLQEDRGEQIAEEIVAFESRLSVR